MEVVSQSVSPDPDSKHRPFLKGKRSGGKRQLERRNGTKNLQVFCQPPTQPSLAPIPLTSFPSLLHAHNVWRAMTPFGR